MHYIKPDWPAPKNVQSYTTTRLGGISLAPYDSFNLADHAGDNIERVRANRNILKTIINLPGEPFWLQQVHGTTAIKASHKRNMNAATLQADAIYTSEANLVCVVVTADCLPILICNRKGTLVAAIHAGWRGLASGIIAQTLGQIDESRQELLAWLGPAISQQSYEVGQEVYQKFIVECPSAKAAFKTIKNNKWLVSLYALAEQQLKRCGLTMVYGGNYCTYKEPELFYSYRRDQGKTGRMATLIWLSA
jgi:YfiH family protein